MERYRANSTLAITIPLVDANGDTLAPIGVNYRLLNELGEELLASTATTFTSGDTYVVVTTTPTQNQLTVGDRKGIRVIELIVSREDGLTTYIRQSYLIESEEVLGLLVNSYQTYNQAQLISTDLPLLEAWEAADEAQRQAALIEAYHRIGRLRFRIRNRLLSSDQFVLNDQNMVTDQFIVSERRISALNEITVEQFNALPVAFITAVRKAQVVEADVILGGDPVSKKREEGLMSDSVGQSSIMFRPGKPLSLSVSKKALDQLSGWVSFTLGVGRR